MKQFTLLFKCKIFSTVCFVVWTSFDFTKTAKMIK